MVADEFMIHGDAVVSMPENSALQAVITTLAENRSIKAVFLLDTCGKYAGMVSRVSLLRWAHIALTGGKGRHAISVADFFRIADARRARDLGTSDPQSTAVREGDSLQRALDKMLDHKEDTLAVLDNEGRLLGDLTLSEVLNFAYSHGTHRTNAGITKLPE